MASYLELKQLSENSELQDRAEVAATVAADSIRIEDPGTDTRRRFARRVYENPRKIGIRMLRAVLATNRNASVSAILAADDSTMQTQVDAFINVFAQE